MFGLNGEKEFAVTQDDESLVRTDRRRSGAVISGLAIRTKDLDI